MKKINILLAVSLFFAIAPQVLAAATNFVPLAPIPGLTDIPYASNGLATFFNNLYKFLIGIAATLAVIEIIWGGLEIATKDSVIAQGDGKKRIEQAILGLVLVLSPVLVFTLINPSILNLSLNIPPINLATAPGTGGPGPGGPPDPTSGCTSVTGKSGVLQIATCPSESAANTWSDSCTWGTLSNGPERKDPGGTIVSVVRVCTGTQSLEFIDLNKTWFTNPLGRLQPLAIAVSNPNNGASAMQFTSTCQSIGWKTCINLDPRLTSSHTCSPLPRTTPMPKDAPVPAECYTEVLACRDTSWYNVNSASMCAVSPSWTPFQ